MVEAFRELSRGFISVFLIYVALVMVYDLIVFLIYGGRPTITNVVREYNRNSMWLEFSYVIVVTVTYLHFFRGWPSVK